MFKLTAISTDLPLPIREEWDRLQKLQDDNYGLVFAVRDSYETVLKVILLSVCYLLKENDDDKFCRTLFGKQMTFGDWVGELPSMLRKCDLVRQNSCLYKYLKKLVAFYNRSGIVKWRNEFIGHGLMSNADDRGFFDEARLKLNQLADFLNKCAIPAEISQLDFDDLDPFMFRKEGHFYLYESVSSAGDILYTDHTDRKRIQRKSVYLTEKRKKYTAELNIMSQNELNRDIYLSSEDKAVNGFYLVPFYEKPAYMENWVKKMLEDNDRGVFLMQGGRGTGKSSFVLACDELNQHGEQKIRLQTEDETVIVRAYYCDRIDVCGANDFRPYIQEILKTTSSEGEQFRTRLGNIPGNAATLGELLSFYQKQYENNFGCEKLLLFIDGIDELTKQGFSILQELPQKGDVPENVYIVLTCRVKEEELSPVILEFIERYSFTSQIEFEVGKENHSFLMDILKYRFDLCEKEADILATAVNDRLTVLPLLENCSREDLMKLIDGIQTDLSLDGLAEKYLDRLALRYGKVYFQEAVRFLFTVFEAAEGLTLHEISMLYAGKSSSIHELCFLRDLSPFLTEYRSYRGNLFVLSRTEYRESLRSIYYNIFADMVNEWKLILDRIKPEDNPVRNWIEWDSLLYICANLVCWQNVCSKSTGLQEDKSELRLLEIIYTVCCCVQAQVLVHREKSAFAGFSVVVHTVIETIEEQRAGLEHTDLLLASAAEAIERAVKLRKMQEAKEIAEKVEELIADEQALFPVDTAERRIAQSRFYGHAMIRFCEEYDDRKAKELYKKAIQVLEPLAGDEKYEKRYRLIKRALLHNYLGVKRNRNPEETLLLAGELENTWLHEMPDFDQVSDYLMVAMCYKSAGQCERAEEMLQNTCDLMEQILQERNIKWTALTDVRELELYFTGYWRLYQCLNDSVRIDNRKIQIWEVRVAIQIVDKFTGYMNHVLLNGNMCFEMLRLNLMMTAALLRNTLCAVLTERKLYGIWERGSVYAGLEELKLETYGIVNDYRETYRRLKDKGIVENKIDAMFNQMNCVCIYAGFGDIQEGVDLLQKVIKENIPENEQEAQVYQIVQNKLAELRAVQ